MKKLVFVVFALFAFAAGANTTITSKEYVDGQVSNLQEQIPAKNANTVVTNTGVAGTIGEKQIYDSSANYGTQTDALVTAGQFNTAVQNALESEFVCIDWLGDIHDNAHCLLYEVRAATPQQILPNEYTQLEYIYTPKGAFIDTGISPTAFATFKWQLDYKYADDSLKYNFSGSGNYFSGYWIKFDIKSKTQIGIQAGPAETETKISTTPFERHLYMLSSDGICGLDGATYNLHYNINGMNAPNLQISRVIGISNFTDYATGYIYGSQMWGNGNLIQNLIPARRNRDNKLGMYDTVSNTFFTNAGTGEFVAGPVISSNLYLPSGN